MNDDQLDKLFAAARQEKADTARAEYGFETRLVARLREKKPQEWTIWAWRLMPAFAAVVIALGAWDYVAPADETGHPYAALAGELELTHLVGE